MISIDKLTVQFGGFELFGNISFVINPKDRIGLIGKNGAGKTTLLKIIAREQESSFGVVTIPSGINVGYLPQQMKHQSNKTVINESLSAFDKILSLEKEIEQIGIELSKRDDYESKEYLKLISDLSDKNEEFHILDGSTIQADTEKILLGLGFNASDFNRNASEFSGGWRMRIELAKILLQKPELLLLDEPTNHLDIESIEWLENFLANYYGAVLMISHDKAFLDNISNRTLEIVLGKMYDFKLPYSKFIELRKEQKTQQTAAYINQQKMIEKTEEFITRFRAKATKAVQVQSKIKQLNKIDRIQIEQEDNSKVNIKFPPAPRSGTIVVETKELTKKFDNKTVFEDIFFTLERGEKIALVGKNGEGKTTFSRIIVGEYKYEGEFKLGHNIKIGYFAQNQDEILDENKTVFQTLDDIAVGDIRTKIRDILGAFLFRGEDIDKKVKILSGGEQSRLAIAKLLLEPVNLLVLDEPTNHLDMRSKEILKQALKNYEGTLVIVSHDRDFLHGLTEKIYEFKNKQIKQFIGDIYEFLERKKITSLNELNDKTKVISTKQVKDTTDNKAKYEQRKLAEKEIRKAKNLIKKSEEEIERLELLSEELILKISQPENSGNNELLVSYNSTKKLLDKTMNDWEIYSFNLEKLLSKKEYI